MSENEYKYRREDFPPLPITLNHLTLSLNFIHDRVEVTNLLDITAEQELQRIELDAKGLEILAVEWVDTHDVEAREAVELPYRFLEDKCKLIVETPRPIPQGQRFLIRSRTRCVPSDNILEGIYKDTTPPGAPQQYISQCQQWGFQRIAPIFDDCRAKCTMTTTIEADARYTHLISNGNISKELNPEGKPVPKPGDPTRQIIRYENSIPMAPYLFLVCAGTWDVLADEVTYPSGRSVRLEYLVPPGRTEHVKIPMEILKQSVLWVGETQGYEYTADTYRTICMNKSNFGGMENVGNTTIVTDAALIDEHTLDQSLLYAHGVIVHEFEHNQCGSETTMETPFDVWLNEAYTVDVERRFMEDLFDPAFIRLNQVDSIRSPLLGPLAIEDGGRAGRIVREGFNDPDELIDGVTYVKAAEVIRMLRLIVGTKNFEAGKALYFSRYKHGNANTDQFFRCFEEVSGRSLDHFKEKWLYTIGYPKVTASARFDAARKELTVQFRQETPDSTGPFHIPIKLALVDSEGNVMPETERVFELREVSAALTFEGIDKEPAFASINRDYSFYGTFSQGDTSHKILTMQARRDTNPFNRVEAMRQLTDLQRIGLLLEPNREVDPEWLDLYGEMMEDETLPPGIKAYLLRIDEQPLDRRYAVWYPELAAARERLVREVNSAYRDQLLLKFYGVDTYGPIQSPKDGIEERILKHILLDLIAADDTPDSHRVVVDHLHLAATASDRVSALLALNRSSCGQRRDILEKTYEEWHGHLSAYANYLRVVSSGTRPDVFDMIEEEKRRTTFDLSHPTWSRALLLPMAVNNKMVWTERGVTWVAESVIELAPINGYVASRLLNTFQHARKLRPELQTRVLPALERIAREVPADVSPTVHGQAKGYFG